MLRPLKKLLRKRYIALRYANSPKIFCIGMNKTGTSSMRSILRDAGFHVAPQSPAELLIHDWSNRNFAPIFKFVRKNGLAFQDIPFSLPKTFKALDNEFPKSKFILTVRDSPDVWYESLIRFHSKIFGTDGQLPTKEDLMNAEYLYKGFAWDAVRMTRETPEDDLYNKDILIADYVKHNQSVIDYFKDRPNKLLVLNLKDANAGIKLSEFLELQAPIQTIHWENKT